MNLHHPARWYFAGLCIIIAALLAYANGPVGAFGGAVTLLLLPGTAIAALLLGGGSTIGTALSCGGALSPLFAFLAALPFVRWRLAPEHIVPLVHAVFIPLLIAALATGKGGGRRARVPAGAWVVFGVCAAGIAAILTLNPALRVRSDAWFHAAVTESIARGGIPPEDPYYAGIQLRYFWAYHVLLGALRAACGCTLFTAMAIVSVLSLLWYLSAVAALSARLSERRSAPIWSALMVIFGVNAFGALILIGRSFLGATRGTGILLSFIDGGVHGIVRGMSIHYAGSIGFFLDKFLVATPFAVALVSYLMAAGFLIDWLFGGERRHLVLGALFAASSLFFHTIVGVVLLACGFAALGFSTIAAPRHRRLEIGRRSVAGFAALAAAVAACLPYLLSIASPADGLASLVGAVNGIFVWTVLAAGIVPIVFCAVRLARGGVREDGVLFCIAWIAAAFLLGVFMRLPLGNINKIVYLVLIPLAALAGDGVPAFLRLLRVSRIVAPIVVAVLAASACATAVFGITGYLRERGLEAPVTIAGGRITIGAAEAEAYRWMRDRTPSESVFINDSRTDILVLAPRRQLWTPGNFAVTWGYEDNAIAWRRDITGNLYHGDPLTEGQRERLRNIGVPVFVVYRPGDGAFDDPHAAGVSPYGPVFRNDAFLVYELMAKESR